MVRRMVVRDLSLLSVPSSYSLLLFQERRVFIWTHPLHGNRLSLLRAVEKKSRYYLRKRKKFRGCFNLPETSLCEDQ